MLEIRDLSKSFGLHEVISDFNLQVGRGERHALIGPNGAGKTTLLNIITGWIMPDRGTIELGGTQVQGRRPAELALAGITRSFQRNLLLEGLTVHENLRLACQAKHPSRRNVFRSVHSYPELGERAEEVAGMMGLTHCLRRDVRTLSYGEKRQLEVAISLAVEPTLLLLDEPAAGTSPVEKEMLVGLIKQLPKSITLVLVEHDMDVVFGTCDRITVLSYGRVLASGSAEEIRASASVREAYLGKLRVAR